MSFIRNSYTAFTSTCLLGLIQFYSDQKLSHSCVYEISQAGLSVKHDIIIEPLGEVDSMMAKLDMI